MSRSSTSSSRRGMSLMKTSRSPHARCASSASRSHISSNRPSACILMNRISNVAGAIDVGGGGRTGSRCGGMAAIAPAIPVPVDALANRPKSSAGHVVNWPATRATTASTALQRRRRRTRLLTNDARCCVISPDCIQNVDNSQAPPFLQHPNAGQSLIRIGVSAWRVAPRPQPAVIRRTIASTSASGTPTGQAAAAASRSGESPSMSEDASPNRA